MSGIGIIANPHSKLNKRNPWRKNLLSYIVGEQGQLEVTDSLEELSKVANDFHQKNIEILGINGGDGTISQTLTAIIREYGEKPLPRIAILKGGTMNMLAANLGIRGAPEQVLYRLVENYSREAKLPTTRMSTLKINDHYGFLFGNGVASNFLNLFYQNKSGPLGVCLLIAKIFVSRFSKKLLYHQIFQTVPTSIATDESEASDLMCSAVFCATVQKMPMGLKMFPLAKNHKLQVSAFHGHVDKQVWQLPKAIIKSANKEYPGRKILTGTEARIVRPSPYSYTLDGELFECDSQELRIELGPQIDFIVL